MIDWLTTLKDFGFPVTMAIGLLILLTRNMEEVKNAVNDFKEDINAKLADALGKLTTNQTLLIGMAARQTEITDIISKNQIAIANGMAASQVDAAGKLYSNQTEVIAKLNANQAEILNRLSSIQTDLASK
jgi:hypothetical protein